MPAYRSKIGHIRQLVVLRDVLTIAMARLHAFYSPVGGAAGHDQAAREEEEVGSATTPCWVSFSNPAGSPYELALSQVIIKLSSNSYPTLPYTPHHTITHLLDIPTLTLKIPTFFFPP